MLHVPLAAHVFPARGNLNTKSVLWAHGNQFEVVIGPAGSRAMGIRARAGSRCTHASGTYT